mmetsp:Transcript_16297/g.26120  ORF Transcript_16297/g.26120 Transcript_16297/m.26120 type:complete len:289 (-) Transcript_16297:28-894(-)
MVARLLHPQLTAVPVLDLQRFAKQRIEGLQEVPGRERHRGNKTCHYVLHALDRIGRGSCARHVEMEKLAHSRADLERSFGLAALNRERNVHHISARQQIPAHLLDHQRQHAAARLHVLSGLARHTARLTRHGRAAPQYQRLDVFIIPAVASLDHRSLLLAPYGSAVQALAHLAQPATLLFLLLDSPVFAVAVVVVLISRQVLERGGSHVLAVAVHLVHHIARIKLARADLRQRASVCLRSLHHISRCVMRRQLSPLMSRLRLPVCRPSRQQRVLCALTHTVLRVCLTA